MSAHRAEPAQPERPWCYNRPDRSSDALDNECKVWAGDDNKITVPTHPQYGQNVGDYFPRAYGWICVGCRHLPEWAQQLAEVK